MNRPRSTVADLLERRARVLGPAYRLFYSEPVHVVRAEGVWIYDADGKAYLDAYNNVSALGHGHPRIVSALSRAAARLNTHTRYVEDTIVEYAERLLAHFPGELQNVMLTCSGSEANDLALRIAKAATGGTGVVVTRLAYHGVTGCVAEISPSLGAGVPLGPHVRTIPAPDSYRNPQEELRDMLGAAVRDAIADMNRHGARPAALIVDTIFSSDGVFSDPAGFLEPAVGAMRAAGGLFIADEVQAGFGRTGCGMWGFQRHGVVPDIVTLGKPMGNGYPLAGIVARRDLVEAFATTSRYFNTFAGNPVACAAGLAVLDVLEEQDVLANVVRVGDLLRRGLGELKRRFEIVGDVRGAGLFFGVEIVSDAHTREPFPHAAAMIVDAMRRSGVLISATGPHANVLKLRPLLVFESGHADLLLDCLAQALQDATGARRAGS